MFDNNRLNRRKFIKTSFAGAIGTGVLGKMNYGIIEKTKPQAENTIKEYRTLGRTGFKVSDISFGSASFTNPGVLQEAIKLGMNYIDTAEAYGRGQSERTIGEVIKKVDRSKLFITTKIALQERSNNTMEGIRDRINECLERLDTDYIDCLMIHMGLLSNIKHEAFHAAAQEMKAAGKVKFLGLSNHGKQQSISGPTEDGMEEVIAAAAEDGRFDVVLFTYNFILRQPGERILKICKEYNIGTTLMKTNPVHKFNAYSAMVENFKKEGREIPDWYTKLLKEYGDYAGRSEDFRQKYDLVSDEQVRDAAMKFVIGNPDVHTATITINNFEELNNYIALSGGRLTTAEGGLLSDYEGSLGRYYCRHACGLCESACPGNIPVNTIMRYNHYFIAQGREKHALTKYSSLNTPKADKCRDCSGYCESACPHNVPVHTMLITAHQNLSVC
ncbi:aldo/keto reductase [candidate division KSB1 bacterium]